MPCIDSRFDIAIFDTNEFDILCHADVLYPTRIDTTTSQIYGSIPSTFEIYKSTVVSKEIDKGNISSVEINKMSSTTTKDKKSKSTISE
jgi:hypothetical protein